MTTTLAQIVVAVNTEAMRYEASENAIAQVSSIEQVCSFNGYRYFVVAGNVFRKVTWFSTYHAVRVDPKGDIIVYSDYTAESAKASCFADCDRVRARFDKEEAA